MFSASQDTVLIRSPSSVNCGSGLMWYISIIGTLLTCALADSQIEELNCSWWIWHAITCQLKSRDFPVSIYGYGIKRSAYAFTAFSEPVRREINGLSVSPFNADCRGVSIATKLWFDKDIRSFQNILAGYRARLLYPLSQRDAHSHTSAKVYAWFIQWTAGLMS